MDHILDWNNCKFGAAWFFFFKSANLKTWQEKLFKMKWRNNLKEKVNLDIMGSYSGAQHLKMQARRFAGWRPAWATQSYPNKGTKTVQRTGIHETPSRGIVGVKLEFGRTERSRQKKSFVKMANSLETTNQQIQKSTWNLWEEKWKNAGFSGCRGRSDIQFTGHSSRYLGSVYSTHIT